MRPTNTRFPFLFCLLFVLVGCGSGPDVPSLGPLPNLLIIDGITLSGIQENPAVNTAATGTGRLSVDLDTGQVTGSFTTTGVAAVAAHIHTGFAGQNGGILVGLTQAGDDQWDVPANTFLDADDVQLLRDGGLYVNVHSAANPPGEIRGQILPASTVIIFNDLNGTSEVPPVSTTASGRAALTINSDTQAFVLNVMTSGVDDAVAAHIHEAFAGANGPVIVGLEQDSNDLGLWSASGTFDNNQYASLLAGGFYVNVHTPANPPGELRGQLLFENITVIQTTLSGSSEIPAVMTTATGSAALTVDTDTMGIVLNAKTIGLDDATAAHIHQAFAGDNGPVAVGLTQDAADASVWSVTTTLDQDQYDALRAGEFYVNVHSQAYPAGELRGQLVPENILVIEAALSGDNEIPPVATTASGIGAITVNTQTLDIVLFARSFSFDNALTAHIHNGFDGATGRPIVTLEQNFEDTAEWSATAMLTAEQFDKLLAGGLYINIHSPEHPPGEIRGQLLPEGIIIIKADLSGANEVPPVVTTASGRASLTVNTTTMAVALASRTFDLVDPFAAHIHEGAAGTNGDVIVELIQSSTDPRNWSGESVLTADQYATLFAGGLYINIHTTTHPSGELRGQFAP